VKRREPHETIAALPAWWARFANAFRVRCQDQEMPNTPVLDRSVQWRINAGTIESQELDYGSAVQAILSSGLATAVVRKISAGKEADVYLATYNGSPIAVKAYRLFRTVHRGGRPIKTDTMSWIAAREYEMLRMAWKGGVPVPAPARRVENMFSMRYLGDEDGPAPRLQDVRLEDPDAALSRILTGVEAMAVAGVVHADLSAFNILVHGGKVWFIDLSQALRVDRLGPSAWRRMALAEEAVTNGLKALRIYFRRYGLTLPVKSEADRLVKVLDRFRVMKRI